MKINICLSSSNEYSQHLGVTIASILKNARKSEKINFYILDGGISDENKAKLLSLKKIKDFSITFYKINYDEFKNLHLEGNHVTVVSYFRYKIAEVFSELDKILYLDCDMIIQDSLGDLYKENIDEYWIAGVEDLGYYYHRRELKRETESFYINTGVILMNLKKWREDNISQKLFDFTVENGAILVHQDQDVINMVLNEKSKPLEYKWNVQDSFYRNADRNRHPNRLQLKEAKNKPSIIHFTGKIKPWDEFIYLPMAHLYLKYLEITPWKGSLPTNRDVKMKILKGGFIYFCHHPLFLLGKKFWMQNSSDRRKMLLKYLPE